MFNQNTRIQSVLNKIWSVYLLPSPNLLNETQFLSPGNLAQEPYKICITSFLARFLRVVGFFVDHKKAVGLSRLMEKNVEIFLPFFNWFNIKSEIRQEVVNEFKKTLEGYGMTDLRSFHGGYAGQGFLLSRFFMNPGDPRILKQNIRNMQREINLLGELRKVFKIEHPIIYVLHCGRREKGIGREESIQATVSSIKSVMGDALTAGVCISLENTYSHPGEEEIGTFFGSLKDVLSQIGVEWIERGVLGCTLDPAHALLTYSGNYDALEKDLAELLPWFVHIHVNHPRTARNKTGELFSEWSLGDDNHNAPVKIPNRTRYWSLLGKVIANSKISSWRTITYEVNWAVPILRAIFGGSPLNEVRVGWEALERFCNHPTERFDVPAIERYIDAELGKN